MTLPEDFRWLEEAGLADAPCKIRCPGCFQKLDLSLFPPFSTTACPACGAEVAVPVLFYDFQLFRLLYAGRRTRIYQAHDYLLQRDIALKICMDPEHNEYYRASFERLATLAHPGILWIYKAGDCGNFACGALQLMHHGNVTDCQNIRRLFGIEKLLASLIPVIEALCMTSRRGVVHRDICPANLFCDADGALRLANFRPGDGEWPLPSDNWRYRSPEALNFQQYDATGDLYSFAVTVYQLMSGLYPFGEVDEVGALLERQREAVKPLDQLNPLISRPLAAVIAQAMNPEPRNRPEPEQLVRACREALAHLMEK